MGVDCKKWTRNFDSLLIVILLVLAVAVIIPNAWSLRTQRLATFEIIALVALSAMIFRMNKPLGMLLGWAAATAPFHEAISENVNFAIMAYGVWYLFVVSKEWNKEWIWNTICCLAILSVFWQVLQTYGIWYFQSPWPGKEYIGLLGNPNESSAFLAICLPAFFRMEWRWGIVIVLIGLYLGVSIGGIVAAYLSGLVFLYFHREMGWKKLGTYCVVMTVVFSILIFHKEQITAPAPMEGKIIKSNIVQNNLNNRARYWKEMLPIAAQKPIGWGLGQFQFVMPLLTQWYCIEPKYKPILYDKIGDKEAFGQELIKMSGGNLAYFDNPPVNKRWDAVWREAHNEYLELWFMLGFVGLLYALIVIYDTLKRGKNVIAKYGFLISCLSAIWFFSWQIVPIAIITTTYLGVLHHEKT